MNTENLTNQLKKKFLTTGQITDGLLTVPKVHIREDSDWCIFHGPTG
ncbi:25964_t:CDS:2, partial [Gigaspora rosea]